jgi:hypothetical protein
VNTGKERNEGKIKCEVLYVIISVPGLKANFEQAKWDFLELRQDITKQTKNETCIK